MSLTALFFAAFGAVAIPAAEPKTFAAIEKEWKEVQAEAQQPLPAVQLQMEEHPGPRQHAASERWLRDLLKARPERTDPAHDPSIRRGHLKRYDAPQRFGRPLAPPYDDFETLLLRSQQR